MGLRGEGGEVYKPEHEGECDGSYSEEKPGDTGQAEGAGEEAGPAPGAGAAVRCFQVVLLWYQYSHNASVLEQQQQQHQRKQK